MPIYVSIYVSIIIYTFVKNADWGTYKHSSIRFDYGLWLVNFKFPQSLVSL